MNTYDPELADLLGAADCVAAAYRASLTRRALLVQGETATQTELVNAEAEVAAVSRRIQSYLAAMEAARTEVTG